MQTGWGLGIPNVMGVLKALFLLWAAVEASPDFGTDYSPSHPLAVAAAAGNCSELLLLLQKGRTQIDTPSAFGMTALHLAAAGDHVDAISLLLEHGASTELPTERGMEVPGQPGQLWTPLFTAAYRGHTNAVRALLDGGAQVDAEDAGESTPLMIAANVGREPVVAQLLVQRAGFQRQNKFGISPLMFASDKGHAAIAKRLVEAGASVEQRDKEGWTALMFASFSGQTACRPI